MSSQYIYCFCSLRRKEKCKSLEWNEKLPFSFCAGSALRRSLISEMAFDLLTPEFTLLCTVLFRSNIFSALFPQ